MIMRGFDWLSLPLMARPFPKLLKCFRARYSDWEELKSPVKNMKFVEGKIYVDKWRVNFKPSEDNTITKKGMESEEGRTN